MPHVLLAALLASTPASPPPAPELVQSALTPTGTLLPSLEAVPHPPHLHPVPHRRPGGSIRSGISQIVAGSICLVLGGASAAGGISALVGAGQLPVEERTPLLALGWTFTGVGILFGVIGLPLLLVGIGNLVPGPLALTVTQRGELAVTF